MRDNGDGTGGNGNGIYRRPEISIKVTDCPEPTSLVQPHASRFMPPAYSVLVIRSCSIDFYSMMILSLEQRNEERDKRLLGALPVSDPG